MARSLWLFSGIVCLPCQAFAGAIVACAAIGLAALGACKGDGGQEPADPREGGLGRGDRVVIETAAAQFYEGQVLDAAGTELRVQTAEQEGTITVSAADAYRLPAVIREHRPEDYVICSPAPGKWTACQVERVEPGTVVAVTVDERLHRLAPDRVLVPTALTSLNLRRRFQRARERHVFVRAVKEAGPPRAPQGWSPGPREQVLGYRESAWYAATVNELEDDGPYLRWSADGRVTKVAPEHVVPEPPYQPGVQRGQYALVRPPVAAGAWQPVRVASVGPDAIVVADVDGNRRSVAARDVVPLR
jgi:hypothetical protein